MARYALILIKWVGRPSKLPRGWLPYRTSIRKTCAVDDRLDHRSGGWAGKACPPERADSPDHLAGRTRRSSSQLRATSGRLHWSLQCPFVAERRWWVQDVQKKHRLSLKTSGLPTRTAPLVHVLVCPEPSHHGSDEQVFGAKQQFCTGPGPLRSRFANKRRTAVMF
jgi:hypothetical protein